MRIEPCRPDQLDDVVALLDDEFVFSRGRSISLARRYPQALSVENLSRICVVTTAQTIGSIAVARRFSYLGETETSNTAMIGFVYTRPGLRGRGIASQALRTLVEILDGEGTDAVVLWTSVPSFYARHGWIVRDESVVGRVAGRTDRNPTADRVERAPAVDAADRIERLRRRWSDAGVIRSKAAYAALPLPATSVEALFADEGGEEGYALVGRNGSEGYLYECGGSPSALSVLWAEVERSFATVLVNERADSPGSRWLKEHRGIELKEQGLTMWRSISGAPAVHSGAGHVPYFDRI